MSTKTRRTFTAFGELSQFAESLGGGLPLKRLFSGLFCQNKRNLEIHITDPFFQSKKANAEVKASGNQGNARAVRLEIYCRDSGKKRYVGYILLRQRPAAGEDRQVVCDTTIRPYVLSSSSIERSYITALAKMPAYERGRPRRRTRYLATFPFIQKHGGNAWACAAAVLRCFTRWIKYTDNDLLSVPSRFYDMTMPQIEKLVNPGGAGIDANQFVNFFSQMGLHPLRYVFNDPNTEPTYPPDQLVYSYMESGLPVFVLFAPKQKDAPEDLHVVAVVGHTFDPNAWWPEAERSYYSKLFASSPPYIRSSAWVDYIIQDDNYGPFLTLPKNFLAVDLNQYSKRSDLAQELARQQQVRNCNLAEIIVPFRPDYLTAEIAEGGSLSCFYEVLESPYYREAESKASQETLKWKNELSTATEKGNIVLRTFLISRQTLQKNAIALLKPVSLPQHMWLTEISTPILFASGIRLGLVIIDPRTPEDKMLANSFEGLIYLHIPGFQIQKVERDLYMRYVEEERPVSHLVHTHRDYGTVG